MAPAPLDKQVLRRWALRRRARQSPDAAVAAGEALACRLREFPAYTTARVVAGYLSLPGELSTAAVLGLCHADGKQVVVPAWNRVLRRYGFCRWTPSTPLGAGPMAVPEPAHKEWFSLHQPDLVLVPGLVFDRAGGRIGFGAGHYDRLLARCRPGAVFVGMAYPWQVVDRVPQSERDVRLHAVATPAKMHLVSAARILAGR
jgi:5-formyltetrahydrofolate cyclo-ligase